MSKNIILIVALACVDIKNAACQPPTGPPPAFALNQAAVPIDTKRTITRIALGPPTVTELSSTAGFAQGFTISLAPYKLLPIPPNGTSPASTHHGFYVRFDMDNNGSWDTNTFVVGPGPEYDASARGTGTYNFPEPAFPDTHTRTIAWVVIEERILLNGHDTFVGDSVSGSVSVTILPMPDVTYADVSVTPPAVPSTLTGYLSWDGRLDRPLVIVEGFDPSNTTYPSEYFGDLLALNGPDPSFINTLQSIGYDVFVYNLGDGGSSLRGNAWRLVGALMKLKAEVYNLPDARFPTRVMGVSAGGVISRYALAWAEENDYDHGCDMFISADAPQNYAWLSTSFQRFLEMNQNNPMIAAYAALLQSPAAKELLRVNEFDAPPDIIPTQTSQAFFGELNLRNGNGYPHRTRNIGLSFGQGSILDKSIEPIGDSTLVEREPIATVTVSVPDQAAATWDPALFGIYDIRGGSLQPAFKSTTLNSNRVLWNGKQYFFRILIGVFSDPVVLHTQVTLGANGAPSFIHSESALDLFGVVKGGDYLEHVRCWSGTKFDEIYMDPPTTPPIRHWHDEFPKTLASIAVQKLFEYQEVVAPAAGFLHPNNQPLAIEWKWRSASSVDIAYSSNGGATYTPLVAGIVPPRKDPFDEERILPPDGIHCYTAATDPNSNGYLMTAPAVFSLGNQTVIKITSHYPGGDAIDKVSDKFTVWDVNAASIVCVPSFSCDPPTMSMQIQWTTSIATDGQDIVEVYPPGESTPQVATGTSQGTSHLVNWHGSCEVGLWLFRVKSTKIGSGTVVSSLRTKNVTGCAGCPPPCNPPCELD